MSMPEYSRNARGHNENDLLALIPQMRAFARFLCRDGSLADDLAQDALTGALKTEPRIPLART
jgi:DNA-directed RNA polymerase specialized sigma24 family protein